MNAINRCVRLSLAALFLAPFAIHGGVHFEVIKSFDYVNESDNFAPVFGLIQGSDGALYGSTTGQNFIDGSFGGSIFRIEMDSGKFTTLHSWRGISETGVTEPSSELLEGVDGRLYGIGEGFGAACGNKDPRCFSPITQIFRMAKDGSDFEIIHQFTFDENHFRRVSNLIQNEAGFLYGITSEFIFRLKFDGSGFQALLLLDEHPNESDAPMPGLAYDGAYLYGAYGGDATTTGPKFFRIRPDGSDFKVLYTFAPFAIPRTEMLLGSDRALYGIVSGPDYKNVKLFRISRDGEFKELYKFDKPAEENALRVSRLTEGRNGYLYGTRTESRETNGIFRVRMNGTDYLELHSNIFGLFSPGGNFAPPALVLASNDVFYAVTPAGGAYTNNIGSGGGSIYALWPPETPDISSSLNPETVQARLDIKGISGLRYELFRSSDLLRWDSVIRFILSGDSLTITDPRSDGPTFYRASWIP